MDMDEPMPILLSRGDLTNIVRLISRAKYDGLDEAAAGLALRQNILKGVEQQEQLQALQKQRVAEEEKTNGSDIPPDAQPSTK